jgi:putative hydrolase of the HAD superfamily
MIEYLLFDLDNTLYSARYGLELNMGQRIIDFASAHLGISPEAVVRLRSAGLPQYGTTLEWLMTDQGFTDVEAYFATVHPEGEDAALPPDPELRQFLENLPIPKAVLTNSPREHADRILKKLGITDLFTHIFDVRMNGLTGKPHAPTFYRALSALGSKPETTLFIDDYPKYVEGYLALGGKGLLLDELNEYPDYPHPRIRELRELVKYL